jgi:hypothetical protein
LVSVNHSSDQPVPVRRMVFTPFAKASVGPVTVAHWLPVLTAVVAEVEPTVAVTERLTDAANALNAAVGGVAAQHVYV